MDIVNEDNVSSPENCAFEEGKADFMAKTSSISANSSSSVNSDQGFAFQQTAENYFQPGEEVYNSLLNFRGGYDHFGDGNYQNGSFLSFNHHQNFVKNGGLLVLEGETNYGYDSWNNVNNPRLGEDINCFESATSFVSTKNYGGWIYSGETNIHESGSSEAVTGVKRCNSGESVQALKKQSSGVTTISSARKKYKPKTSSAKDPQSLAAKNRRERISQRLKILQELVPNGTKVDMVTMLEKAISYVKFLQLQVKVLATDEFWPVQGGKAPDISQVKEAIDTILSSQKDRTSSSK